MAAKGLTVIIHKHTKDTCIHKIKRIIYGHTCGHMYCMWLHVQKRIGVSDAPGSSLAENRIHQREANDGQMALSPDWGLAQTYFIT